MKTTNCVKCESLNIKDVYNNDSTNLNRTCMNCGFTWEEFSADSQTDIKDSERIVSPN